MSRAPQRDSRRRPIRAAVDALEVRRLLFWCDVGPEHYAVPPAFDGNVLRDGDPLHISVTPRSGHYKVLVLPVRLIDDVGDPAVPGDEVLTSQQVQTMHARNDEIAGLVEALYPANSSFGTAGHGITIECVTPNIMVEVRRSTLGVIQVDNVAQAALAAALSVPAQAAAIGDVDQYYSIMGRSSVAPTYATVNNTTSNARQYTQVSTQFTGDLEVAVWMHELGHNFGLFHAGAHAPGLKDTVADDLSPIAPGSVDEYGDKFTFMGGEHPSSQVTLLDKYQLGWLDRSELEGVTATTVNADGIYKLYAHDRSLGKTIGATAGNERYGLFVPMDALRDYWLEYRNDPADGGANEYGRNGVQLRWSRGGYGTALLDLNNMRHSSGDVDIRLAKDISLDAPLTVGNSFNDPFARVTFTTLRIGTDPIGPFCEVKVTFGTSPGTPTVDLVAETTNLVLSTSSAFASQPANLRTVRFEAAGADPDGTAATNGLAYAWEVGLPGGGWQRLPTSDSTQRVRNHTFTDIGLHRLRVTASDGTGRVASDTVTVLAQSASTSLISGRVVDAYGAPIPDARVAYYRPKAINGSITIPELLLDSAVTDSDGFYAVVRSAEPTATFVVLKPGHTIDMIRETGAAALTAATRVDFVAVDASTVLVTGTTRGGQSSFIAGATVHVGPYEGRTDEDGAFAIRVPRGRYAVSGTFADGWPLRAFGVAEADAAFGDAGPIHLFALGPTAAMVTVALAGFVPDPQNPSANGVTLRDSAGNQFTNFGGPNFYRDYVNVPLSYVGTTHLYAVGANRWAPADRSALITPTGGAPLALSFTKLPAGSRSVVGRVRGDDGIAGAAVTLYRDSDGASVRATTTDAHGVYALVGLAAGAYHVEVVLPGGTTLPTQAVNLPAGGTADVQRQFDAGRSFGAPELAPLAVVVPAGTLRQVSFVAVLATGDPSIRYAWSAPGVTFAPTLDPGPGVAGTAAALFPGTGTYAITVTATDRFGRTDSETREVVINAIADQIAPVVRSIGFAFEREQALYLQLSEALAGDVDLTKALVLTNTTTKAVLDWADFAATFDGRTNTLKLKPLGVAGGPAAATFANGRYALFVNAEGLQDAAGQSGSGVLEAGFTMLAGDATMDGTVGFADLVALSQHYDLGLTDATWSDGDFDYDGDVDFEDLVTLAQAYNQSV